MIAYGLNVTIGNPPQSLTMLLDIEWDTFFVQSSACESALCKSYNHTGFNSSASTSYVKSKNELTVDYNDVLFSGKLARDTLSLAGLNIDKQPFLDARDIWPRTFFHWYIEYNGVIGFAPRYVTQPWHVVPSPWQMIVGNELLDHNVFSIQFPAGSRDFDKHRTNGELTIGGITPQFSDAEFLQLPLIDKKTATPWATGAQSLIWGDGKTLREDFDGGIAFFSTALSYILLPGNWTDALLDIIGANKPFGFFKQFACDKRKKLPNLTFVIGGHTISLSAYEYSFEIVSSSRNLNACVVGFERSTTGSVGLGLPFMENFYTVFDQDAKQIKRRLITPL